MKQLHRGLMIIAGICITINAFTQERKYLYLGFEMENFKDISPFQTIINDYNDHHAATDQSTEHSLALPDYILGYTVGYKIHSRFSEFGGNVHFTQFSTNAKGVTGPGNEYFQKLIVSHNGFFLFYRLLLINTNYFRSGPGIGVRIEQFKTKLNWNEDPSINTMVPANKALFAGQINYNLSIGGPKFNFDIGVFYQIPFWKIDLNLLNERLNEGFATNYTNNELIFEPVSFGVCFTFGLGSKENYDF